MSEWISVKDRLPGPEERVLVCTETHYTGKSYKRITTAMYEDGTVWREKSDWNFNEFDNLGEYDEERDDWKIPEGWWEYTLYNDDNGNYPIDDVVTHWMPLPGLPSCGSEMDGIRPETGIPATPTCEIPRVERPLSLDELRGSNFEKITRSPESLLPYIVGETKCPKNAEWCGNCVRCWRDWLRQPAEDKP